MNRNLFKTLVVILGIFVTFTASANYDPNDEYEVFIQDDRNQTDFVEYLVKQKLRAQELLEKIGEKPNAAMLKRLKKIRFDTDIDDNILSMEWRESKPENDDLKNYKAKAEFI